MLQYYTLADILFSNFKTRFANWWKRFSGFSGFFVVVQYNFLK